MIEKERIQFLNGRPERKGDYVLYWMQASQRERFNQALEYAIDNANRLGLPVIVYFGIDERFPSANLRHFTFMLEGLSEVRAALAERGIKMVVRAENPLSGALALSKKAGLAVTDAGYLDFQRSWRVDFGEKTVCRAVAIECDVVVPVHTVSQKAEYAARTIRPKITRRLPEFLRPPGKIAPHRSSIGMKLRSLDLADPAKIVGRLAIDRSVPPSPVFRGGTSSALKRLKAFLARDIFDYGTLSNDPSLAATSRLSPYLHFGQISPVEVALTVAPIKSGGARDFLEQLIVRRELALNHVRFNPDFRSPACLPDWARKTLAKHRRDRREKTYRLSEFERARTHDEYWNAAQREMTETGHMHNYMRMYWGKKIVEWTNTPEEALRIMVYLNDKYELDGRDPNGYTGIAWCLGLHDRPWSERKIFGTVRYMNAAGLERKFDMPDYLAKVAASGRPSARRRRSRRCDGGI